MLWYYKLAYQKQFVFRVVFWVCLSIMKMFLDFCVEKTILSLQLTGISLSCVKTWVYLNAGMEEEPVDSGRKAACLCFPSRHQFSAALASPYCLEGLLAGRIQLVVYHPGYGSLGSDLAIVLRLIGRLFCMEQKSKHKIRYHCC